MLVENEILLFGEEGKMAVLARPGKKAVVLNASDKKAFVKKFNNSLPSETTKEQAKKAGKIFKWEK